MSNFKLEPAGTLSFKKIYEEEEDDNVVFFIREEIVQNAFNEVDKIAVERDAMDLVAECAVEALRKVIALHFYYHIGTVDINLPIWHPDKPIPPSQPDSWATRCVPIRPKPSKKELVPEVEVYQEEKPCECELEVECLCINSPEADIIEKPLKNYYSEKRVRRVRIPSESALTISKTSSFEAVSTTNLSETLSDEQHPMVSFRSMSKSLVSSKKESNVELEGNSFTLPEIDVRTPPSVYESESKIMGIELPPIRARSWLIACGRKDLLDKVATLHNSYRICDAHFPPWMFQRGKRLLLRKDAVPIKLSPDSDTDEPVPSSSGLSRISNTTNTSTSEIPHTGSILRHILESDACSSFDKAETATSSIQTSVTPTVNKASKEKLKEINTTFRLEYIKLKKQNRELLFRCSNLKKRLAKEQEKTSTLEQYKTFTYAVCRSKEVAELVNIHQTSQSIKSGEERKYSNDYKLKCLSLYFSAPKVYESLLTKLFCLPETQMLRKFLRSINISPGLEVPNLFKTLKMKVDNFNEIDKYCVLCVDEMRIKPNCFFNISADHIIGIEDPGNGNRVFKPTRTATVLLARGIFSDWEQPLSYFFYNNTCPAIELLHIIFDAIQKLRDIGLNVIVVVSDMSSNNIQVKSLLQITPELPYFTFEDQKIFFMFDTPNLLKAMRNKLMKYDFLVFNEIISWKYIEQFYNIDKGLVTGSAPKLTDSHIFPGNLEKMQVKYASQVFSATVSSALNASVEVGTLSKNAQTTADFIDTVDKLFDLLNSSNTSGCKQYNLAFMGFDFQVNFFNEILSLFENFKVVNNLNQDITSKMKFITGFRITINSVLSLWSFMESNKISSVFTRRLNLDPLENLFCVIRQQNKNCVNPTAIQFQRSFRKICCSKLFNSGLENCKNDTNNLFLTVSDIIKEDTSLPTIIDPPLSQKLNIPNIDTSYQKDTLLKINFVRYLANFLIEKCLTVHSCDTCETYSKNYQNLDETTLYSYYKAYTNADLDLLGNLSHNDFIELISLLETLFQTNFENLATQKNLIKTFESICKPVKFLHPCELFPFRYLIRLFGRVRLFHTLKYINRNFKNVKDKKVIVWKNN